MTLTTRFGNLMDYGFLAIPNLLLDNYEELGLNDDEVFFVIKCMRHKDDFRIHDEQLSKNLSSKTMQRRRNSLKVKGFLETTVFKEQNEDGTWSTLGIEYDFSNLILALTQVADKLSAERAKLSSIKPKVTALHNTNHNTSRKFEIPAEVNTFLNNYKTNYGLDYKLTSTEKLLLEKASPEFLRSIPFISEYTKYQKEYGKLPASFTGRLIFFQKVDFRQAELIAFANDEIEYLQCHNNQ